MIAGARLWAILAAWWLVASPPAVVGQVDSRQVQLLFRVPVTDTTPLFQRTLGATLVVHLRRDADALGTAGGWYLEVVRQGDPGGDNLLYHSRAWHGPYPTDLFAWIHQQQYYLDERVLPVYGYPYELRLRCIACETVGEGPQARFTGGTVQVEWRRVRRLVRRGGAQPSSTPANAEPDPTRFEPEIRAFEAQDRASPPPRAGYLLWRSRLAGVVH